LDATAQNTILQRYIVAKGRRRLVSVVKMVTVLEERNTKKHCSDVYLWKKGSVQRLFIKKCILFTVGSVCRVKLFTAGSRNVANVSLMTVVLKRRCGSG
jgi:hypothetical protein